MVAQPAPPPRPPAMPADIVSKFQKPLAQLFLNFGNEVLDCVRDAKGISVEDVRAKVLRPWKDYVNALNASTSDPMPVAASSGQRAQGSGRA